MNRELLARRIRQAKRDGTYHTRDFQDWLEHALWQLNQSDRSGWYDRSEELEGLVVRREY